MFAATPSNRNHITLYRLHIGLAAGYAILLGSLLVFSLGTLTESGKSAVKILSVAMPLFHIGLAWGCKHRHEISRKISQVVGFLMLIWLPIGPIFGYFLIRYADWKSLPNQKAYAAPATNTQIALRKMGIEYRSLQTVGIILFLISPIAFAIILADGGLGFHILSSSTVMLGHWAAIAGMLTLTPVGLVLFLIGTWLNSRKNIPTA